MPEAGLADLMRETMLVTLRLGGPLLLVALVTGFAAALLQAVTQINEATLTFLPKLVALGIAFGLLGPFMFASLAAYARTLFDRMAAVGGS
jgi:flagellar biosynthetic protein FliQ